MLEYRKPSTPRDQMTLWSERLDDAVPLDHPVRLMEEVFSQRAFEDVFRQMEQAQRQKEGQPGYSPRMLAKVVVYCHLEKIRSSRRMAAACVNRVDVRWLSEGLMPDHTTFTRLFRRHRTRLQGLLRATVKTARKAGLLTLEHVAVDGTFIEANASRKSVLDRKQIEQEERRLDEVIKGMLKEHEQNDRIEDALAKRGNLALGDDTQSDEERKRAFEEKRDRLRKAAESIERRQKEPRRKDLPSPNPIASVTDPDSRHMKDKEHRRKPNYNVQMAVDSKAGVVVATRVDDHPNDMGQAIAMVDQTKTQCGELPVEMSFDAGYHTGRAVAQLQTRQTTAYVSDPEGKSYRSAGEARDILASGGKLSEEQIKSLPRDSANRFTRFCFVYDQATDTYRCPASEVMRLERRRTRSDRHGKVDSWEYATGGCATCRWATECSTSKWGRRIMRTEFDAARMNMLRRTSGPKGKERSSLRSRTVEPRFGEMKSVFGLRKFLRRGREMVATEVSLVATAMNLGRLIRNAQRNAMMAS